MKSQNSCNEYIGLLFLIHYKWLRRRVSIQLGCRLTGEDIASETFAQLLGKPLTLPIREPKAFLATIAKRLILQGWRRKDVERAYLASITELDEPISMTLDEHAQIVELLMIVDALLSGLSSQVKSAFLMSQIDGLTYPEIAAELGISERSVSNYMKKAFTRCLKAVMEPL